MTTAIFRWRSLLPLPAVAALFLGARPSPGAFLAGAAMALAGSAARLWAVGHIGPKSRSTRKLRATKLVTGGPYAHLRHPLYTANALICAGLVTASGNPWLFLLLPFLFSAWLIWIVPAEEAYLGQRFPLEYPRYRSEVPSFFPRLSAYERVSPPFGSFAALRAELNTLFGVLWILVILGQGWLSTGICNP